MAVLQWQIPLPSGAGNWSDVSNWIDIATSSAPSSLGAGDTYIVQIGGLLTNGINLDTANLGHLYIETRGADINVNLASYNAKSIIFGNKFGGGCPLKLTQSATVIAMDGTHSGVSPNYGMPIAINGSLSSTSSNAISTLKFTLGGSTQHILPSSGQMDCVIEVLSGSQAILKSNPEEENIWSNTYLPGGSALPLSNPNRALNSLRIHQLLLPTNTTQPTRGGNQSALLHKDGVEYPQYTLEVGYGLASSVGIISTNNPTLNLTGIKVVFWCTNSFTLPCDNLNTSSGMVQNTNPDACTTVLFEDVELRLDDSATSSCVIKSQLTFRAVSLTIGAGIFLQGQGDETHAAHIELVQKPTIRGTWNFEEQTDGFYKVMDKAPITSTIHATHCHAHILKEIRVDGYIKVKERATAPNSTAGFGMFWVDDAAPNTPMFTDDTGASHNLLSGGGGGTTQNLFETIAVAGQTDVVADSATDTLTLVAGSNMTITTNASADSITFASASGGGGSSTFTGLTDTPANYTASAGKVVAVNSAANALEFITAGIQGITIRDEGSVITGIASPSGNIDFVGAGVTATSPSAGSVTVTIPGGGGGGGYPLFAHDEAPSANNFSPFRLLADGDTIEIGVSSGGTNDKDVSVFTPTTTNGFSPGTDVITADRIGAVGTNTGREYIFYGQVGKYDSTNLTKYRLNMASNMGGVPTFFVRSMSVVSVTVGVITPVSSEIIIVGLENTTNVRVLDAGTHTITPVDLSEEEPEPASSPLTCRLLLICDHQVHLVQNPVTKEPQLLPNYGFTTKDLTSGGGKGGGK